MCANCLPDCAPDWEGCNIACLAGLVTAAVVKRRVGGVQWWNVANQV